MKLENVFPFVSSLTVPASVLLSPQLCVYCGCLSQSPYPLCRACFRQHLGTMLPAFAEKDTTESRCVLCGRPLVSEQELCAACRTAPVFSGLDSLYPLFHYSQENSYLVSCWKTKGQRVLSALFAWCILTTIRSIPDFASYTLVPVPPRPGKVRQKGWDQIEDIVRLLEKTGLNVYRCLERTGGLQQKMLGRAARSLNLKGYISVKRGFPLPEKALLIDDLCTTGATLDACAVELKNSGCSTVSGITLFYD